MKAIRNKTVEVIAARLSGVQVFNSKVTPQMIKHLPSVSVYVEGYTSRQEHKRVNAFLTTVTLQIVIIVAGEATWADEADDLVASIKTALLESAEWRALWNSVESLQATYESGSDGQKTLGSVRLTITGNILEK